MKLKPSEQQTSVSTGGTSGIGLATARRAEEEGAQVVLVARDEEALDNVCSEIRADGGRAEYVAAEDGVREEVRHVVDTVVDRLGGFETWVNDRSEVRRVGKGGVRKYRNRW